MQTIKAEYERHQKEHKVIDQFQGNVEKCREAEVRFHGEELKIYGERMTILQKAYNELLVLSNKRVSDLHTLHDFIGNCQHNYQKIENIITKLISNYRGSSR